MNNNTIFPKKCNLYSFLNKTQFKCNDKTISITSMQKYIISIILLSNSPRVKKARINKK